MEWSREERYRKIEDITEEEYENIKQKVKSSPYRQKYHIQPNTGLLNDPNGFSYFKGKYHLFHQWFPLGPVHGVKYWYHLSSADLVLWEDEGIAMAPDTVYDSHGVFSGSALPVKDCLYMFYTGNTRDNNWIRNSYQCIAIMDEKGNITKNDFPFIDTIPEGYTENFRDPKVFKKNEKYYCLLGAEKENSKGTIVYYSSENLSSWKFEGELKTKFCKNSGFMWECPDYFEINGEAVLMISPQGMRPEGDLYKNVFQSGYLLGKKINFKEGNFEHEEFEEFDRGFEFYAPQTMEDPKGRRILIGWFGLPGIESVTDKYGWSHCMTLPRIIEVKNGRLFQKPLPELKNLRKSEKKFEFNLNNEKIKLDNSRRNYELKVNYKKIRAEKVGIKFRVGKKEETVFYYDLKNEKLIFNREKSGKLVKKFEGGNIRKCSFNKKELELNIFLDESSVEIFVNDGLEVFSSRLFNESDSNDIIFFTDGEVRVEGVLWEF